MATLTPIRMGTEPGMMMAVRSLQCGLVVAALALAMACSKKENAAPPVRQQAEQSPASVNATNPWRMELKVSPEHPSMIKPVAFVLHISDEKGRPISDAQVNGVITMKEMDMGKTAVKFAAKGHGDYEASTKSMDMSGAWNLAVEASVGDTQVKRNFEVTIYD